MSAYQCAHSRALFCIRFVVMTIEQVAHIQTAHEIGRLLPNLAEPFTLGRPARIRVYDNFNQRSVQSLPHTTCPDAHLRTLADVQVLRTEGDRLQRDLERSVTALNKGIVTTLELSDHLSVAVDALGGTSFTQPQTVSGAMLVSMFQHARTGRHPLRYSDAVLVSSLELYSKGASSYSLTRSKFPALPSIRTLDRVMRNSCSLPGFCAVGSSMLSTAARHAGVLSEPPTRGTPALGCKSLFTMDDMDAKEGVEVSRSGDIGFASTTDFAAQSTAAERSSPGGGIDLHKFKADHITNWMVTSVLGAFHMAFGYHFNRNGDKLKLTRLVLWFLSGLLIAWLAGFDVWGLVVDGLALNGQLRNLFVRSVGSVVAGTQEHIRLLAVRAGVGGQFLTDFDALGIGGEPSVAPPLHGDCGALITAPHAVLADEVVVFINDPEHGLKAMRGQLASTVDSHDANIIRRAEGVLSDFLGASEKSQKRARRGVFNSDSEPDRSPGRGSVGSSAHDGSDDFSSSDTSELGATSAVPVRGRSRGRGGRGGRRGACLRPRPSSRCRTACAAAGAALRPACSRGRNIPAAPSFPA